MYERSSGALIFCAATKLSVNPAPSDLEFIYIQTGCQPQRNRSRANEIPTCPAWIVRRLSAQGGAEQTPVLWVASVAVQRGGNKIRVLAPLRLPQEFANLFHQRVLKRR